MPGLLRVPAVALFVAGVQTGMLAVLSSGIQVSVSLRAKEAVCVPGANDR